MKCCNLAFNAQGLRVIIVIIKVRIVKIFVITAEAFKKKERHVQFTIEIMVF